MRIFQLIILIIIISCKSTYEVNNYSPDDVLVYIDSDSVSVEEFIYSFKKSHQNEDSISRSDIDDYLRLFINYKLKVSEARKAGYDTAAGYKKELAVYQEQLRSSYRASEKIVERLKQEAYDRLKTEVNASHILIRLPQNPSPQDTLKAYEKIKSIKSEAEDKDFEEVAVRYSEDPSAKSNKGNLGYFSVFRMVYPFERAAYSTPEGEISEPFRTSYGYHILKVHDKRPAVYKIALQHIQLHPKSEKDRASSRDKIFVLHEMLNSKLQPEQIIEAADDDRFNIKFSNLSEQHVAQMPEMLREAAMQLEEAGQVSDPVQVNDSWHIFILKERTGFPSYETMEPQLDRMVRRTDRLEIFQEQFLSKLKEKHNLYVQVDVNDLEENLSEMDDTVKLFTLGERAYNKADFMEYLAKLNISQISPAYDNFIKDKLMEQEDAEVLVKNPELQWLLREYEEGMLLFNIMEDSVWNKAANDKPGLEKYIADNEASAMAADGSSLKEPGGNPVVRYQAYLEEKWIQKLRDEHTIFINQPVLIKVYEKILD